LTRKAFWGGVAGLYLAGILVVLLKSWQLFGQIPIANVYQVFALLMLPLIWGILPIILAVAWLAIRRFDLSRAKTGLFVLAAIYLVLIYFQWQSLRPVGLVDNKQERTAAEGSACYSDRELMASIVLRNLTRETVQIEQCAIRSGNQSLPAKWESFLRRHKGTISEQETLVEQAYRRIFGNAWEARLGLDMQVLRSKAMSTDLGGRTPAECARAYENFFEAVSYLSD
jgi:hypothetical protein